MTLENILEIGSLIVALGGIGLAYSLFILQNQTFLSQLEVQKLDYQRYLDEILPDFKFTPLKDAIKETVDWFESNYQDARI